MLIRQARHEDIKTILSIVRSAQLSLCELGIDQWQDGYPTPESINQDIANGVGYIALSNNEIIGYEFISFGRMMDMIKAGEEPKAAMDKATGRYGRFDDAVKYIDPREE